MIGSHAALVPTLAVLPESNFEFWDQGTNVAHRNKGSRQVQHPRAFEEPNLTRLCDLNHTTLNEIGVCWYLCIGGIHTV
jgi:hypothetical protein